MSRDMVEDLPCVDLVPGDVTASDMAGEVGASCVSWLDCDDASYCQFDAITGNGECVERCESASCESNNEYCSEAGLCLVEGINRAGTECTPAEGCEFGFVCDPLTARCVSICDPRNPECVAGLECAPFDSGLGRCVSICTP